MSLQRICGKLAVMKISIQESPTFYVSELGYVDSIITPVKFIDNVARATSIERVVCIFKCRHANVRVDDDGVYCYNCNNHDLTLIQAEELQEDYMRSREFDAPDPPESYRIDPLDGTFNPVPDTAPF